MNERPPCDEVLAPFFVDAFFELSTCRNFGFIEGPIPWTATVDYARRHGLTAENERFFCAAIRAMDEGYLKSRIVPAKKKAG